MGSVGTELCTALQHYLPCVRCQFIHFPTDLFFNGEFELQKFIGVEQFAACPGCGSWELQCQGLNRDGGKATSVGLLGSVRSKLIVLFGEVHPELQLDLALAKLGASVRWCSFFLFPHA